MFVFSQCAVKCSYHNITGGSVLYCAGFVSRLMRQYLHSLSIHQLLLNYVYNENICMYKKVSSMLLSIQSAVYDYVCHSYSLAFTSATLTF
jgi:hypothetical protein